MSELEERSLHDQSWPALYYEAAEGVDVIVVRDRISTDCVDLPPGFDWVGRGFWGTDRKLGVARLEIPN